MEQGKQVLHIKKLNKVYPGYQDGADLAVLENLSMHADEGEFISIIGPSGCGKSTIFKLLCGMEKKTSGEVLVCGRETKQGDFAYMPQKDLLMEWKTVAQNIATPLRLRGMPKKEAYQTVKQDIKRYGLAEFLDAWPSELSGGMRQRAAFYRTMLTRGDIMLLDEPFASLDALNRERMQEWLMEVIKDTKKTILFVTHSVDEAIFLSDRIYVLSERPATVCEEIKVPLLRPRTRGMITSPQFNALKATILKSLEQA